MPRNPQITPCQNIYDRFKGKKWLVLIRPPLAGFESTADIKALTEIIEKHSPQFTDASLNRLIGQAIVLGQSMGGTDEGNQISTQLFELVRKCGARISRNTVERMVIRGETYSRVGITALGILYDNFFDHIKSLGLPAALTESHPSVAYYCAYREAFPNEKSSNVFANPSGFSFAGLRYIRPEMAWDKYANRGPSALLDYLTLEHETNPAK